MKATTISLRCPPVHLPNACHAAWHTAHQGHAGQYRSSDGQDYITHPETVATVAHAWGWPVDVVKVALLHDVLEDSDLPAQTLAQQHGQQVCNVVLALSKDKRLPKTDQGPEAKCRLALALPHLGPQAGVVKLIDRAHNMVTAQHLPKHKQMAMVSDAQYFFAPLARVLGLESFAKWLDACCPAQQGLHDGGFVELMQSFLSEAHPAAVTRAWRTHVHHFA